MAHTETTLNSQTIFSGRIIEVKKDDIQLENGKKSIREVVVHHGGVCVAAIDQEDRLLLVRQFRYPYGKELLELPAGKIELGEDPRECGIRELQEECGCTADRFEKLAQLYPLPIAPRSSTSTAQAVCTRVCRSWTTENFWMCCAFPLRRQCRW